MKGSSMLPATRFLMAGLVSAAIFAASSQGADLTASLKAGTPDIKSVGPLAFGPDGVLFVGDRQGAAIFAIDTGDRTPSPAGPFKVQGIDEKIAAMLGTEAKQISLNALAVNPASGRAYLSVSRGRGPDGAAVLVRVDREGKIEEVPLKDVKFSKAVLPNPPQGKGRQDAITRIAFVKDRVIVAGLSNEEFASKLRAIPFPFTEADKGASVEIYHGSHGRFETNSPVRTFVAYDINGEPNILAAYTCTPLVKIPVSQLKPGERVKGTTIAELGNRNNPLDMIVYQKDGKDFILMANSSRGIMKIPTQDIDKIEGITKPQRDKAGAPYETVASLKGVQHLDLLDKENALVLVRTETGPMNLELVALP
jgi:hypothetical protein